MTARIEIGTDSKGQSVSVDLEELLATRLLVQGNSGSGKSHLLRRLLEGSASIVQQVVVDPEGDFVSLADAFDHIIVEAADFGLSEIALLAARVREHRASVVLNLEGLEVDDQLRCTAAFLGALFDAPRQFWYPVLTVIDEAQLFAPAAAGEVAEDARRASLSAMTNLMCRGRKRGLAGVVATQRLAKLAKNVAAEASNFLMGRTFLDIDMARASDLLGMDRRQADMIRDLQRGEFLALGPALSRRPVNVRIGPVRTAGKDAGLRLVPLPEAPVAQLRDTLFSRPEAFFPPPPSPTRPAMSMPDMLRTLTTAPAMSSIPDMPSVPVEEQADVRKEVLAEIAVENSRQPLPALFQDFVVRCRMRGVQTEIDLGAFRQALALARAGINDAERWEETLKLGAALPEEMLAPFLAIVRAAREERACPDDDALAHLYGTSSPGRARRMLAFIEEKGLLVSRTDLAGRRTISIPHLGWTTLPATTVPETTGRPRSQAANAARPDPLAATTLAGLRHAQAQE
ncbi:helicase HerA domain-containing protein [Rhizorhapis sp. SPR117]|uniref:helicase HerA domain-containing protein n=1 Tax=Rhizorhapis sp. SPR117 TaxID=2912611 RepID=UPI001F2A6AEC|nr:ATP-binding protein [Rhizorhapis sp. SPR117]